MKVEKSDRVQALHPGYCIGLKKLDKIDNLDIKKASLALVRGPRIAMLFYNGIHIRTGNVLTCVQNSKLLISSQSLASARDSLYQM